MSTRRTSTVAAVAISLLALSVLVLFAALGSGGDEGDGDADPGEEGVPSGFERIPDDVFFERIFGSQRTAGSWHFEQNKTISGVEGSTISADTVFGTGQADNHASVGLCCEKDGALIPIEVIVVDGVYFAKGLGSEKPWWRIDPSSSQLAAGVAKQLSDLISQETSDDLQEAVQSVIVVGPDSVEGVETVHYRLTLGNPDAGAETATPTAEPSPALASVDVWVDAEQRPVRMVMKVGDGRQELVTTTTYTQYGEDFAITEPPPAQVTTKQPPQKRAPAQDAPTG